MAPPPSAGAYKVGVPYEEAGVWYYPREQADYDETGVASWYGAEFHGKRTANGEVFDADGLTAAHPTLPMPVNVRVTNLENGRSLMLRVNDRGPFARGRIIDVSARAARLLGFYDAGTAKVRVTYLGRADVPDSDYRPPEQVATAVASAPTDQVQTASLEPVVAGPAVENTANPVTSDAPPRAQLTPVADPAATRLYVQAGTFRVRENAERLTARLASTGAVFISPIDRNGAPLYRVRVGPFDDIGLADAMLAQLVGLGGSDARIVVDQ